MSEARAFLNSFVEKLISNFLLQLDSNLSKTATFTDMESIQTGTQESESSVKSPLSIPPPGESTKPLGGTSNDQLDKPIPCNKCARYISLLLAAILAFVLAAWSHLPGFRVRSFYEMYQDFFHWILVKIFRQPPPSRTAETPVDKAVDKVIDDAAELVEEAVLDKLEGKPIPLPWDAVCKLGEDVPALVDALADQVLQKKTK